MSEMVGANEILAVMVPGNPYTAGELSELLDEPRSSVDRRLRDMRADDMVNYKRHSPNRVSWWTDPVPESCPECGHTFHGAETGDSTANPHALSAPSD